MNEPLYSVRMRASLGGAHISGAERIAGYNTVESIIDGLVRRAMGHERGSPDSIRVCVDSLSGMDVITRAPLTITLNEAGSAQVGRELAVQSLIIAGVTEEAARSALAAVTDGAAGAGINMRGAMIVDAVSGKRLEPDRERGLRARVVDYAGDSEGAVSVALVRHGLDLTHLKEALALATKVANAPGSVAELCISDDPSYVTGYVASEKYGYMRITPMKLAGDPMGGRAFFVDADRFDMDAYIFYMRETPVLVSGDVIFK